MEIDDVNDSVCVQPVAVDRFGAFTDDTGNRRPESLRSPRNAVFVTECTRRHVCRGVRLTSTLWINRSSC